MADAVRQHRVSDGTRLAYELGGRPDAPTALLCDGISCDGYVWKHLRPWLEERFRILHVHYRGHGRSGIPRDPEAVTLPHLAADMAELLDHLALGPAVAFGHSMGVQVILEMALRTPEHVQAGVLLCGSSGRLLDTFKETDLGMRLLPGIRNFTERYAAEVSSALRRVLPTELSFRVATWTELNRELIRREDFMPYLTHFATMPPDLFTRMLHDAASRTADPWLGRVTQPMLVVAGDRDGFTPSRLSQAMADALPCATFVLLEGGSHTAPLEVPERVEGAVADFIARHGPFVVPRSHEAHRAQATTRFADAFRRGAPAAAAQSSSS
ncbi:MAG: alpha/beta hydrolase [Deltaproteobacteria bacterium]|nr:alpha/beta hydrolase [Deltaproteobacteria bacterium]MCB9786728.1 alpha/beta hydrolase [Deltaproteobacteria bacterium]